MANINDSLIIDQLIKLPDQDAFNLFIANSRMIQDDATYWMVLGTLWKLCGSVKKQKLWLPLFKSNRRSKQKIMKGKERKEYNKLPKRVKAYRAINDDAEKYTAISWTLSEDVAKNIFSLDGEREVISRWFYKEDIFAYFDRRNEQEIIVIGANQ